MSFILGRVIQYITLFRDLHAEHLILFHIKICDYDFLCREKAKKALWFAETYGLVPLSLKMEHATGQEVTLNLTEDTNRGKKQ